MGDSRHGAGELGELVGSWDAARVWCSLWRLLVAAAMEDGYVRSKERCRWADLHSDQPKSVGQPGAVVPVVQITYDVPADIAKGLASGELSMLGTAAVRNNKHIAAHIREVSRTISDGDDAVSRAVAKGFKNPKFVIIGLGVAAVVAVGGGAAWAMSRKRQDVQPAVPECVANYNASLAAYLDAIGSESLNAELVTRLISDLDALKENTENGTIAIKLSVVESEALVALVADYTSKFAEANAVSPSVLEEANSESTGSAVIDLRRYLEAQRQIFDESA